MPSIANEATVTELGRHLASTIPELAKDAKSTGHWTEAVYKSFALYRERREGWKLYPETKAKLGEFLCDFMLFEDGYGPRVACESQWWHSWGKHADKLGWAFDKLVGVKADIKVFIYEGNEQQWAAVKNEYLKNYALLSTAEAFLVLHWDGHRFHCSWWQPTKSGVQTEVEFRSF